jgi:hypothetical protein
MECSICYENFLYANSQEETIELYANFKKNKNIDEFEIMSKFEGFLITSKHNETQKCDSPNCNSMICGNCWIDYTADELLVSNKELFKCPFCRQIYWKYYMKNNVHSQLIITVLKKNHLSKDEIAKHIYERLFKK